MSMWEGELYDMQMNGRCERVLVWLRRVYGRCLGWWLGTD